jgi:nucleotide-binding universal stress UspA family protein
MDALQRFAEIEGLAQHVNTEIKRQQSMDDRIDLAAGGAFQDSGISPRLLVEVGQKILDGAKARAERKGLENVDARLEGGDPADRILLCIDEENIDCVIMGSRGLNRLKGLFLGSVSHKVANRAPCTCIAVK